MLVYEDGKGWGYEFESFEDMIKEEGAGFAIDKIRQYIGDENLFYTYLENFTTMNEKNRDCYDRLEKRFYEEFFKVRAFKNIEGKIIDAYNRMLEDDDYSIDGIPELKKEHPGETLLLALQVYFYELFPDVKERKKFLDDFFSNISEDIILSLLSDSTKSYVLNQVHSELISDEERKLMFRSY